ncbi:four helix bundle protein [Candidatus Uhrbacteria bacterium]|nr:four helix bundle protein [Candidatus Uhrbacteria bacterium]
MNYTHPFHLALREKIDAFVEMVYLNSDGFPKSERFESNSQLRRAALSVALNYVEGYARMGRPTNKHFLEISYGSLKETEYLIRFCTKQGWIEKEISGKLLELADELGRMLWSTIQIKKRPAAAS